MGEVSKRVRGGYVGGKNRLLLSQGGRACKLASGVSVGAWLPGATARCLAQSVGEANQSEGRGTTQVVTTEHLEDAQVELPRGDKCQATSHSSDSVVSSLAGYQWEGRRRGRSVEDRGASRWEDGRGVRARFNSRVCG